jgi:hypothetical protein
MRVPQMAIMTTRYWGVHKEWHRSTLSNGKQRVVAMREVHTGDHPTMQVGVLAGRWREVFQHWDRHSKDSARGCMAALVFSNTEAQEECIRRGGQVLRMEDWSLLLLPTPRSSAVHPAQSKIHHISYISPLC